MGIGSAIGVDFADPSVELDSLMLYEVVVHLEEITGVEIGDDQLCHIRTADQIADLICRVI